jgi:hypothetical protein
MQALDWENLVIARATPAPALSINASTSTPLAKAALAFRICAEVKIGEFNQPFRSFGVALASECSTSMISSSSKTFFELFLERGWLSLVWSMRLVEWFRRYRGRGQRLATEEDRTSRDLFRSFDGKK